MSRVAVLGAGAWGTAISCALSARLEVSLWARDQGQAAELSRVRQNLRYLPGIELPAQLRVAGDLTDALRDTELVLVATPVAGLREVLAAVPAHVPIVWLCKGFEEHSGALPHQVVE